jgi:hypothetical protein
MAISVGRDTLFQDRKGKWFVKFRQGSGASAREVVVALERVTRVLTTYDMHRRRLTETVPVAETEGSEDDAGRERDGDAGE